MRKKIVDAFIEDSSKIESIKQVTEQTVQTGSTLLNLACSDSIVGGFGMGRIVNIIGSSQAGKSILCVSLLAQASQNPDFKDYRLVYDDCECALGFDISKLFGKELYNRMVTPKLKPIKNGKGFSSYIEEVFGNISKLSKDDQPFIYIVDSYDALTTQEDEEHISEKVKAFQSGVKAKGTYGQAKSKTIRQVFRKACECLQKTNSLLVIVSQAVDTIGSFLHIQTRAGAKPLEYYSSHTIWLSKKEDIKLHDEIVGRRSIAKIKKNRLTGKLREVPIDIYSDYGVDDISANVYWLCDKKVFTVSKKIITAPQFDFEGTEKDFIEFIEENNKVQEVEKLVCDQWAFNENRLYRKRKPRYV